MVELLRRADGAGHDRRVPARARSRAACGCGSSASRAGRRARRRRDESRAILERLGFEVLEVEDGVWDVSVPYWRDGDVYREADLIEEIARVLRAGEGADHAPRAREGASAG